MSIDPEALSRQFHQIHKDIYADIAGLQAEEREALVNLASAVGLAASLADVVTMMRLQATLAVRRALSEAILSSLPTQTDGSDR